MSSVCKKVCGGTCTIQNISIYTEVASIKFKSVSCKGAKIEYADVSEALKSAFIGVNFSFTD